MKKAITTITLAATLAFGSVFATAGIIVAGSPGADNCKVEKDGIIVAGRVILGGLFGIIVAGNPVEQCTAETDGIIVAG